MKFSPEILSPQLEIILSIQSLFLQFIGRMVIKKKMKHWLLTTKHVHIKFYRMYRSSYITL